MQRPNFKLLATSTLSLSLAVPLANAQTAGEDTIEELVVRGQYLYRDQVTALRSPTPILDVPQSLSIVTSEQIAQQGFTSIGDIVNYTPGITNSQGEGHRDAVVFRGVRSTADFFIDGARDDVQYYRPLYNLEQVEVLRGPNALLFGRGGTGGIINRVTKKGVIGENFFGYQARADSFGEYGFQFDSNFDTGDNSAVRVNAFHESLENHRDFYEGDRYGINPTARFALSPATTLDLSYEYADHDRFIDRGVPTGADGRPVEAFEEVVFGDPDVNKTELQAHLFRATLMHDFTDSLKGNFNAFYGDYDKLYQNFYASGYDASNPFEVTLDGYLDTTQRENLILSGDFIWEAGTGALNHTIIAGGEYIDTSSNQDRYNAYWDTTEDDNEVFAITRPLTLSGGVGVNADGELTRNSFATDINDDTHVGIDVRSLYIQDEIEISEKLDVIIGARYDSFDIEVFDVVANESRSRTDDEVSPRGGLVYKPMENISFYASYSESFLPRSGEQFANINGSNNQLAPNTFTNLEGGLKWDLTRTLSFTAAVFEIEQSSPQVADNDPETLDVIDSEISGFETQLQGQLTDNWYLSASYSKLDGEQVDRAGPTGLRPRELPEQMFSVWNTYQVSRKLSLGLGLTHQDDSFVNSSNTAILPSYTRVDAAAYYDISEDFRIQLNIENATDELYFPTSHSTHQVTVGRPLNASLTLRKRI